MKFMGSKRAMLLNGLGETILDQVKGAKRFVDLFSGSASVAWFVAQRVEIEVVATDLQLFSTTLANSVIARRRPLDGSKIWTEWSECAYRAFRYKKLSKSATLFQSRKWENGAEKAVAEARSMCEESTTGPITSAYGGYYYSPLQALLLDCLLQTLPTAKAKRTLCLAALISAASVCAAAPGHTAQPFKPSTSASKFLWEAWRRDVMEKTKTAVQAIASKSSKCSGRAFVCDASKAAESLNKDDIVFIDPPYSEVQYSRFYHVLETLARGYCDPVSGEGRYPPIEERPQSLFCLSRRSKEAITELFSILAEKKVRAIVTFPWEKASNGLSGEEIKAISEQFFVSNCKLIEGRFSTLGGNLVHRKARLPSNEMVLLLAPR